MRWALLLLVAVAGSAWAEPPEVKFSKGEVRAEVNTFVVLKADVTNGKGKTRYIVPKSGLSVLPPDLLADPSTLVLIPTREGVYEIGAYAGNADGASDVAYTRVVAGKVTAPPPVDPPADPPPPATGGKFFFVLVRESGPVNPALAAALRLPAWDELRRAGHGVKDYEADKVPAWIKKPDSLPAVVTLKVSDDGKDSTQLPGFRPVPATDAGVRDLLK